MATIPHMKTPVGAIDGANTVFTTPTAYVAGTTVVFLRGIPRRMDWDDGWFETSPSSGIVTLKEPPELGDDLQILYLEEDGSTEQIEIAQLAGSFSSISEIFAGIGSQEIIGSLVGQQVIAGLEANDAVAGNLQAVQQITGIIREN